MALAGMAAGVLTAAAVGAAVYCLLPADLFDSNDNRTSTGTLAVFSGASVGLVAGTAAGVYWAGTASAGPLGSLTGTAVGAGIAALIGAPLFPLSLGASYVVLVPAGAIIGYERSADGH